MAVIAALIMFFTAGLCERSSIKWMRSCSARIAPDYYNSRRRECDLAYRSRRCVVDPSAGGFDFRRVMMSAVVPKAARSLHSAFTVSFGG